MSLETDYPFLSIMHPAHLAYVRNLPINTMNYFLQTLDKLESSRRHEIMYGTYLAMVESLEEVQGVEPKTDKAQVTYEIFRDRCMTLPWGVGTLLIVSAMHLTLSLLFNASDTTSIDEAKIKLVESAESFMRNPMQPANQHEEFIGMLVDHIEQLPETKAKTYEQYVYFCEHVVQELLKEGWPLKAETLQRKRTHKKINLMVQFCVPHLCRTHLQLTTYH